MRFSQSAYVRCTKDIAATILNRVFHVLGSKHTIVIETDDSIEAINKKIQKAEKSLEKENKCFTLLAFLDETDRMNSPYKDNVQSFLVNPVPDENFRVNLYVKESDAGHTIVVGMSSDDDFEHCYNREDWQDWCERMVRLYGCVIVFMEDSYEGGPWHLSSFFDPDGGDVRKTNVDTPAIDTNLYWELMDRLKEETGMSRSEQLQFAISDYETLAIVVKRQIDYLKKELDKEYKKESGIQEDDTDNNVQGNEIADEDLPF